MKILPVNRAGDCRTGTLKASFAKVERVIGFPANVKDDTDKVTHSWGFEVDGQRCGIWDYRGARVLSTWGPHEVFADLFGKSYKI
jgi:hypothetical protein